MAGVTEKDLEQKRDKNQRLREQIAQADAKAASAVQDQNMAIEAAELDAETARLEARLAQAKEAAKVSASKEAASGPLAAAEEQLAAAQAGATPPGVAVDTEAEQPESEKSGTADDKKE